MKNENIMHKNKGFTLIEMLVVIAMIGLLSAVVLVALGPSRNKAKDARIMSDVKQIVAIGQTFYDPTNSTYNISAFKGSGDVQNAFNDINTQLGGSSISSTNVSDNIYPKGSAASSTTSTSFAVWSPLLGGNNFCADSEGNAIITATSTFTSNVCK